MQRYKRIEDEDECSFFYLSCDFKNDCKKELSQIEKIKHCENYLASNYFINRPNFVNLQSLKMNLY